MISNTSCIGIYSVGLLGASIGLSLKASQFSGTIVGFSSSEAISTAHSSGAIDVGFGYELLEEQIQNIDLLFLCSPIKTVINTLHNLSHYNLKDGCIITDVGSTKREILSASSSLPPHVNFIGGHPMAGSERSGPAAADPLLFQNALYALTPKNNVSAEVISDFETFLQSYLGCRTLILEAKIHDSIVAATSHLPHLLAVMLVNHVRSIESRIPGTLALTAGGFRDMTRIASTPFPMWKDIFETNLDNIEIQLDDCIMALKDIRQRLRNNTIGGLFETARDTRSRIPPDNKGFSKPLFDIYVVAPDQPGTISALSSILANQKINIKDIEVLKVREGETGTLRIAFESQPSARQAVDLLSDAGFPSYERN